MPGKKISDVSDSEKPLNVCLFGAALDNGNLGVQALAASLIKIIKSQRTKSNITLIYSGMSKPHKQEILISGEKVKVNVINYRLSPKSNREINIFWILLLATLYRLSISEKWKSKILEANIVLRTLATSDFVGDIFGGDSFSDIYGKRRIILGVIPDIIVFLLKKKLVLLPQTYGPYDSFISRLIAQYILARARKVLARDRMSINIINNLTKSSLNNVELCPDVAFMLDSCKPDSIMIDPPLNRQQRSVVGLNISGLLYNGGYSLDNMFNLKFDYKQFAQELVKKILHNTDADILLIPHTIDPGEWNVDSDPHAARDVLMNIPDGYRCRVHSVHGKYNQKEIKYVINKCDFFVGSRMHACIGALSQGIPTAGVAYSAKFAGVFDSVGFGDMVLDARVDDLEKMIEKIMTLYNFRDEIKAEIGNRIEIAKLQIMKTFDEMLS